MTPAQDEGRPIADIWRQLKGTVSDLWELIELQGQLFKLDLVDSAKRSVWPSIALLVGGLAVLTSFPLILWAVSHGLSQLLSWPMWQGLLAVGTPVFAFGLVLLFLSARKLGKCCEPIKRSLTEVRENTQWVKNTFTDFKT